MENLGVVEVNKEREVDLSSLIEPTKSPLDIVPVKPGDIPQPSPTKVEAAAGGESGLRKAIRLGYQSSITGLMLRGKLPEPAGELNWAEDFVASAVQLAADFPEILALGIAGAAAGGGATIELGPLAVPAAVVTGGAVSIGGTEAIRTALIKAYESGGIDSFEEALDVAKASATSLVKGGIVGGVTSAAGEIVTRGILGALNAKYISKIAGKPKYVFDKALKQDILDMSGEPPKLAYQYVKDLNLARKVAAAAKVPVETLSITGTQAVLEGKMPTKRDIINTSLILWGSRATDSIPKAYRRVKYAFTGKGLKPEDVIGLALTSSERAKELDINPIARDDFFRAIDEHLNEVTKSKNAYEAMQDVHSTLDVAAGGWAAAGNSVKEFRDNLLSTIHKDSPLRYMIELWEFKPREMKISFADKDANGNPYKLDPNKRKIIEEGVRRVSYFLGDKSLDVTIEVRDAKPDALAAGRVVLGEQYNDNRGMLHVVLYSRYLDEVTDVISTTAHELDHLFRSYETPLESMFMEAGGYTERILEEKAREASDYILKAIKTEPSDIRIKVAATLAELSKKVTNDVFERGLPISDDSAMELLRPHFYEAAMRYHKMGLSTMRLIKDLKQRYKGTLDKVLDKFVAEISAGIVEADGFRYQSRKLLTITNDRLAERVQSETSELGRSLTELEVRALAKSMGLKGGYQWDSVRLDQVPWFEHTSYKAISDELSGPIDLVRNNLAISFLARKLASPTIATRKNPHANRLAIDAVNEDLLAIHNITLADEFSRHLESRLTPEEAKEMNKVYDKLSTMISAYYKAVGDRADELKAKINDFISSDNKAKVAFEIYKFYKSVWESWKRAQIETFKYKYTGDEVDAVLALKENVLKFGKKAIFEGMKVPTERARAINEHFNAIRSIIDNTMKKIDKGEIELSDAEKSVFVNALKAYTASLNGDLESYKSYTLAAYKTYADTREIKSTRESMEKAFAEIYKINKHLKEAADLVQKYYGYENIATLGNLMYNPSKLLAPYYHYVKKGATARDSTIRMLTWEVLTSPKSDGIFDIVQSVAKEMADRVVIDEIAKEHNVSVERLKKLYTEYENIFKKAKEGYRTKIELGTYKVVYKTSAGKEHVLAVGETRRKAKQKMAKLIERDPRWKNRLYISSEFRKPVDPTRARRDILMGEEDIFKAMRAYAGIMFKKIAITPLKAKLERQIKIHKFDKQTIKLLRNQVESIKGKTAMGDLVLDPIAYFFGIRPKLYTRVTGNARKWIARFKLGRPVAFMANILGAANNIYSKYGIQTVREAVKLRNTEIGRSILAKEAPYLGHNIIFDLGEVKLRSMSRLDPLYYYSMPEPKIREIAYLSSYIHHKKLGYSEAAARAAARRGVELTAFLYNAASLPEVFRSPTGKLILQFKSYFVRQMELISTMSAKEFARYLGFTIATGGPRAVLYFARSIPILALLGLWDDLEKWVLKKGKWAAGIPGLLGMDFAAPVALQLTSDRIEDLGGAVISEFVKLTRSVVSPLIKGERHLEQPLKEWVNNLWIYYNFIDRFASAMKDGWIRDYKGNKLYRLENKTDLLWLALGTSPLKTKQATLQRKIIYREIKKSEDNKKLLLDKITKNLTKGKPIPREWLTEAYALGVVDNTLYKRLLMPNLTEAARLYLNERIHQRAWVLGITKY